MMQSIGIEFSAKGTEKIIEAFDKIEKKAVETSNVLAKFGKQVGDLGGTARMIQDLSAAFGNMRGNAEAASKHIGGMTANLHGLTKELDKMSKINNVMAGGSKKSGSSSGFFGLGTALPYMLQWQALGAAIRGVKYAITDVGMAGSRKDMAGALGELSAVSFNSIQKGQAERAARQYSSQYADTKAENVIKAMSQTASAYSVEKLGVAMIDRMNQAAMNAAKISKMPDEAMAELMSKYTNSYLMAQDKATYQALQSGGRANLKGFGNVNLGEMYEKTSAMLTKTVEVSNIWGKDIANFMQYAAPVMAQKGWHPAAGLAWAGVMADTGFKGPKAGRAEKDMLVNSSEDFARLMLWDRLGPYEKNNKRTAPPDQDVRRVSAYVNQQMGDPKKWAEFLESMIPLVRRANEASKVDGTSMIRDFKFSKEFIPQMYAKISEGGIQRYKDFVAAITDANYAEVLAKRMAQLDDTGFALGRFNNAWDRLVQGISKSENGLTKAIGQLSGVLDWFSDKVEKKNEIDELGRALKQRHIMNESALNRKADQDGWSNEKRQARMQEMKTSDTVYGNEMFTQYLAAAGKKLGTLPENASEIDKLRYQARRDEAIQRASDVRNGLQGYLDWQYMSTGERAVDNLSTAQKRLGGEGNLIPKNVGDTIASSIDNWGKGDTPPLAMSRDARMKALVDKIDGDGAMGGEGPSSPNINMQPLINIYLDGRAVWNALTDVFSSKGSQWGMNNSYGVGE